MTLSLVSRLSSDPEESDHPEWKHWLPFLVFLGGALLLHLLFFLTFPLDWFSRVQPAPVPVDIHQVDPRKLEAIKKQWRNQEKQLLLNRDKSKAIPTEPPPDARYMSDRNRRVEREQRARDTAVLPRPGAQTPPQARTAPAQPQAPAVPAKPPRFRFKPLPSLGNLGLPLKLNRPAPRATQQPLNPAERPAQPRAAPPPGGDQYVDDRELPPGSENLLNTQESVYYSFYARLYEVIGPLWESQLHDVAYGRRNIQPGDYSTVVDVVFDRNGALVRVDRLQSSGIAEFDEVVNQAWRRAGRFPNPPSGLLDPSGQVHTGWNFTVKVGGAALQFMPPERTY